MQIKGMLSHLFKGQRGAAMTELLVSLPALLLMGLGGLQSALLFDAKTTINYATFEAARKGAVNHAQSDAMRRELGLRLAPLFGGDGSAEKALSAITHASLDVQDSRFTEIEIINPTIEAFDEFGREIVDPRSGDVHFGIPNSRLRWRERDVGRSGVNIQDANLLKVKVTYGYQLKVPLMDRVIPAVMRLVDPEHIHYYNARRLPITSVATVRMQSDAWRDDNNVHMMPPGGGGTPPSTEDDPQNGGATPDDDEGQGGDDNDTDTPTDGDDQASGEGDTGNGNNSDGDDLPSISDGDDQGPPPCDPDDAPGLTDSPTAQNAGIASSHTGNPIHVVTGNKYQQEVDLTPLPGALGLLFKRHYNSHSDYSGPLGHGWSHSYDLSLKPDGDGYRLHQSDGRVIHFQLSDTPDHFVAPRISDGWLRINEAQFTWHWRDGRQLQFSPQGQLQRIVLATGQTLNLFYDPQGKLFLVRDPQGRELSLDHYPNGRLKALYDPSGKETRYRYDDVGNLQQVTRHEGTTRIYHYDDPHDRHNLTGITDERGIRYASWAYDEQDRAVLSTHADQVGQVSLDFSTPGETQVTDSQGKVSTYTTEIRNGVALVTAIQGSGCASCGRGDVSYRYNAQLQLIEVATKDGITKQYQYDEISRTTEVTRQATGEASQTLARYEYADNTALIPSAVIRPSINPQGEHRLDNRYNRQGQPTQLTESGYRPEADGSFSPIQRTTNLAYSESGNLTLIDGPREDVKDHIKFSYDNRQRLNQLKTPDGRTLSITRYDTYGRPQQVRGSGQAPLNLAYNARGKVTQVSQGRQTVHYDYDAVGHLTGITDPDGKQITLNYDEAGRATGLTDSTGNQLQQELDTEGRLTQHRLKDAQGQLLATVSYLYDAQGRLSARQTPRGQTHYRYDDADNLTEVQDPQGHATALDYNGLGQLLAVTQPGNRVTQLHYDEHGNAIGLTDPRQNTTDLIKDDFGNLIRRRHPDTGEVRYAYDSAGNRIEKTDTQGVTTSYRFDAANRLIEETSPSGTTSLDYDPNTGRLAQLTDDTSHEGFGYDDQGHLIQHSRHIDGHRFITQYAYNAQGKLSQKTLPDGQVLSYHYYREGNQKGQLRAIIRESMLGLKADTLVGEIDQDVSDGTTGLTFGNGLRETRHHDKLGRVTAIDHSRRLKLSYQYDEQGRITGIDYNGMLQSYDYDLFGRLTRAETKLGRYRYNYDSLGNRTQKQHTDQAGNTATQENHYPDPGKGNRLLSQQNEETQHYRYNPSGSPEQIGERRYEYDAHQRPVRLYRVDPEQPDKKTFVAEYAYNRFGERIKKVVYTNSKRPKVTYYLYDSHQLTAEADDNGKVTAQYLYQQHRPTIKLEGKTAYAIHTDHLVAPRAVTDEDQQIVWSADYSPFGLIQIKQQQITLNLRLPGQYEDQESGTYYNYQRDYDPDVGRYLTSDPIGLKGGLNTYAYVGGNPLNSIDPFGLLLFAFDGTWIDRDSTDPRMAITSNVELFRQYYEDTNGPDSTRYISGVGTEGGLDSLFGGGLAEGARDLINDAIEELETHLRTSNDRLIDIVGFSRGAGMAREFANVILEMQANGVFDDPAYGQPFTIRFMGLFDSVSTNMVDGSATNSCGFLYDFTISDRIVHVAQAYALNEHRPLFPLDSIGRYGGSGLSANRIEQGFLGAHSDLGAGYNRNDQSVAQNGDLSDIPLQWMVNQAESAGIEMGELRLEHRTISNPTLHDSGGNIGRVIRYPNDPDWNAQQQQNVLNPEASGGSQPIYQRDDPLYQQLEPYINRSTAQDGILGTVDISAYDNWLNHNRGVDILY
ncbi:MAG: RHS repeat-associated core domain-containing protein [Candidatus Thiodiazotropha endolucinida]